MSKVTKVTKMADSTSINKKSVYTQTDEFDDSLEIARLQEEMRVLQLKYDVLKRNISETSKNDDTIVRQKLPRAVLHATPRINAVLSSCGCKGNCSSRQCGCVKKDNRCNDLCKCGDNVCQNREENQENKENVSRNSMKITDVIKADNITISKRQKRLSGKKVTSTIENTSDDSDISAASMAAFDPMKPRHQLSRTPPSAKKIIIPTDANDTPCDQSYCELNKLEQTIISPKAAETAEEEVDWEQHTAQLVACKKCKRTFLPHRISKHEACCKKI